MKYCPSCGKAGIEGKKFCPQCGRKLVTPDLEGKQRLITKPDALLEETSWFERHLNWTMVFAWLSTYVISFILVFLMTLIDPYMPGEAFFFVLVIANLAVVIGVGQWVLRKKNRSLAWLLISWTWFFLLVENHSFMRDEYGRTAADYDELIRLDPDNPNAYYERGDFYYEMDEYKKAITDYSKAIELNPQYVSAYFNRAYAYGEIGDYDKAIADYNKTIELDPNDAQAYYNRGLDYQNKGEVPNTVIDLEKCIELSSDPKLTTDAQQALDEIRNSR